MQLNNLKLILGGPGCGKTTRLLNIVEEEIENGTWPSKIAFVTFTKAAAKEAKERASKRFNLDENNDLPWFRTIHSLAYNILGMMKDEVLSHHDYKKFGKLVGFNVHNGPKESEFSLPQGSKGDKMVQIIDFAATTITTLEDSWHRLGVGINWHELMYFYESYMRYKQDTAKIDFTDMLTVYINEGDPVNVDVAIIDEAQDLTPLQWRVVEKAFSGAQRVYVGGDDDQAIYAWAGADITKFLHLSNAPEILPQSYRLPHIVHSAALGVAKRISKRYQKQFSPTNKAGTIEWHTGPEHVNFYLGNWFILARNNYLLKPIESVLKSQGFLFKNRRGRSIPVSHANAIYNWNSLIKDKEFNLSAAELRNLFKAIGLPKPQTKETQRYRVEDFGIELNCSWYNAFNGIPNDAREYYIRCMNNGMNLLSEPDIMIETMHGVKGMEADNVMMLMDMSAKTYEGMLRDPDNEHRVFYVAMSRARESLHLVMPQTDRHYDL